MITPAVHRFTYVPKLEARRFGAYTPPRGVKLHAIAFAWGGLRGVCLVQDENVTETQLVRVLREASHKLIEHVEDGTTLSEESRLWVVPTGPGSGDPEHHAITYDKSVPSLVWLRNAVEAIACKDPSVVFWG